MKASSFPLALIDIHLCDLTKEELNVRFSELKKVLEELACGVEVVDGKTHDLEELFLEADLLILLGPLRMPLEEEYFSRMASFVENGKGFLYAGNGRDKGLDSLNELLQKFGLRLNPDSVKDPRSRHAASESLPLSREVAIDTPLTRGVYEICLKEPSSIEILDFSKAKPLCYGSMSSYVEDTKGKKLAEGFPLLIACSEHKAGRVVAVGDSEFLSDEQIVLYDNRTLVKNAVAWLLRRRVRKKRRGRILFYPGVSFDPMNESGFRRMATDLYSLGYSLDVTSDVLEKPDAEVLIITDFPSSPAAIRSIIDFVKEGGGLIVLADRSRPAAIDRLNPLIEHFGIKLKRTPVGGQGDYDINPNHPLGEKVRKPSFYKPLPMRLREPAVDVISFGPYGGSKSVMAASRVGRGAVVVFGEDWIFRDHSYWMECHYSLMRSAVKWLTEGAEIAAVELDRRIKILRNELNRLRSEVEKLRLENIQLKKRITKLNGEETRVETLKRIVRVDEDVRETIRRMEELGDFSIDTELAKAVLNACKEGVKVAYDVFDEHPKAALERVNTISTVLDAMRKIVESRSRLVLEEKSEREDWR